MNVVAILPTPAAGPEAVRYWHDRLSPNDNLHLVSIAGSQEQVVSGIEIHYLQVDGIKGLQWRSRFVRGIGWRLAARGHGFWQAYLSDIWPEFLWNIQSFDADVIDLRWLPRHEKLQSKLSSRPWNIISSDKDLQRLETNIDWRHYDPRQKISIVLPVYNGEDFLEQSIKSCLEQTHRNIELVIVDDCSKDNSPAIIAKYAALDPRIVSIRNSVNQRLPRSLNTGFAAATGELLTWTSHDNYYDSNGLEALARYLCTWKDIDLVYCDYRQYDETRQMQIEVKRLWPPWQLPIRNVVGAYFLFRRSVYEAVGDHRVDMEYAEDYDFWVRSYKRGFSLMQLRNPLYTYRLHSQSMTAEAEKMSDRPHVGSQVRRQHFEAKS
jgi:cellulose synthase/poly-beta-1,6-N-acetylglucosamine synthase-like glycosyltransferase